MTGFSDTWLALREGVDHRSVDANLRAAVAARLASLEQPVIVDLGAGSGSNLRGLAPHFNARQSWRLVEYDPALIAAARLRLAQWADEAREDNGRLRLLKDGKVIHVEFVEADLSSGVEHVLTPDTSIVTAAAFFDLVSRSWLERFSSTLARRNLPFYTVLTYDGREIWTPPHAADTEMLSAFHAHQAGDKGFGPAAGPAATGVMADAFERLGYKVEIATSDWRLGAEDQLLLRELAQGSAGAVAETGKTDTATLEDWRKARLAASSCMIGHRDVLAVPG
jgi:hypothetical protein